jgi:hypothetical protein
VSASLILPLTPRRKVALLHRRNGVAPTCQLRRGVV